MYLEQYEIGQRFEIAPAVVDREEMIAFARAYDPRPFHLDEGAAAETRFDELFASGFFTLSFAWSRWVKIGIKDETVLSMDAKALVAKAPTDR